MKDQTEDRNKRPGIIFYFGDFAGLRKLPDAELGALMRGAFDYAESGTEPTFSGVLE